MKKVARLRIAQDDQFVPPGVKINANPEQMIRTTGRIKKPKAVFDPSDNYMPRSHRMSIQPAALSTSVPPGKIATSASTSPNTISRRERSLSTGSNTSNTSTPSASTTDICIVCHKREPRRGGNYRNKLVSCIDCGKRVHKLCMNVDFTDTAPVRQSFKCDSCRTCDICSGSANVTAITCVKCCRTFHLGCYTPKLPKSFQTERNWKCSKCQPVASAAAVTAPATAPAPAASITPNKSKTNNNDSVMPVKIIKEIIGDNADLMSPTNKTPQQLQSTIPKDSVKQLDETSKPQQQQSNQQKVVVKPKQEQSEDRVNISEAAIEASMKAAVLRRRPTESDTSSSSITSSDDSDDEDYEYVEKKKRKVNKNEHNNNHNNVEPSKIKSSVKKPSHSNNSASQNSLKELPKRETVKAWSVEQVAEYISEYFPNEANVFKDQEIDGNALLLLKRSDVVQKLPLKLGPSLRLYNLILRVQTQTANDPTLGWDCSVDTLLGPAE